jgi:hypothetical protein
MCGINGAVSITIRFSLQKRYSMFEIRLCKLFSKLKRETIKNPKKRCTAKKRDELIK